MCVCVCVCVCISVQGFSYKRPYAAFLDYFWLLSPAAVHALRKHDTLRHCHSDQDLMAVAQPHLPISQLLQQPLPAEALKEAAENVLAAAGIKGYHLGVTKLFLKSAQAAMLDKQRSLVVGNAATRIQVRYPCDTHAHTDVTSYTHECTRMHGLCQWEHV